MYRGILMARIIGRMLVMKKYVYLASIAVVLILMIWAMGGSDTSQMAETSGNAEIPAEILETLDMETRQNLVEEPKYLALTFDDGPRRGTTDLLLDGLLERGVVATFFIVGEQVEGNEDILQRMKAEGHQIGNHTYTHVRLLTAEKDTVVEEIHKTEVILRNLLGEGEYWLRPPYGLIDTERAKLVTTPMIYWTLDPEDWKLLNTKKVVNCVMEQVRAGDVILLHDFYPTSVDAALELIDKLQAEGYTFVTVEELFRIQNITPKAGVMYASPQCIRQIP